MNTTLTTPRDSRLTIGGRRLYLREWGPPDAPAVVLPFVNSALASRSPFQNSVTTLRDEGVRILLGPGEFEPHAPRTGETAQGDYPWHLALQETERLYATRPQSTASPAPGSSRSYP